jgi:hypothetical protein
VDTKQIQAVVSAERAALAADLKPIPATEWDHPSLCRNWMVGDVTAHTAATARIPPPPSFRS